MPDVGGVLTLVSNIKGVPLVFPLLDIEEQQKVPAEQILNADPANMLAASARYEVPSILAGRLTHSGQCWQSEWGFYFDKKIKVWRSPCQTLKQSFASGMGGAYGILSAYYGAKPEKASGEGL
jgi:hypothetical protein